MATIYSEGDGYAYRSAFNATWASVRDASTAASVNSALSYDNNNVLAHIASGFVTIPVISRTFIRFDSSGITSTLSSATLKLYGYTTSGLGGAVVGNAEDFWVVKSTALEDVLMGNYLVNTSDFDAITGWDTSSPTTDGSGNGDQSDNVTLYSNMYDISGGWSTSGYNSITLNSSALSDLVSQDTFTICLISDSDLKDTPETTGLLGSTPNTMGMYFEDNSGTSKDPYIDYTVATATATHNSVFFGTNF